MKWGTLKCNHLMDSEFWHLLTFLHHSSQCERDPVMPMSHFHPFLLYLN